MNFVKRWSKSLSDQKQERSGQQPLAYALEPRVMFDAAAVATIGEVDDANDTSFNDRKEVAVIDTSINDYQKLIDALDASVELVLVSGEDSLEDIVEALSAHDNIDALHIISHGSSGQIQLGSETITSDNLDEYKNQLEALGGRLSESGDILLYGCEIADENGVQFVTNLSEITKADIAASDDLTGNTDKGGDWDLEIIQGSVEENQIFSQVALKSFSDVLAVTTEYFESVASPNAWSTSDQQTNDGTMFGVTFEFAGANSESVTSRYSGAAYASQGTWSMYLADANAHGGPSAIITLQRSGGTDDWTLAGMTVNAYQSNAIITPYLDGSAIVGAQKTISQGNTTALTWANITVDKVVFTSGTGMAIYVDEIIGEAAPAAPAPTLDSATYNASTGALVITGTNFAATAGATNDVDASKLTITGEGGATYTLTDTADVEITSATEFTLTLSATDKDQINRILNKGGTSADSGTTYDVDGAAGFIAASSGTADTDANGITVSGVSAPTISSATYNASTGALVVTGTNFVSNSNGGTDDIDVSTLILTGEGGETYTLTDSFDVEITSTTEFTVTLSATDKAAVNQILNKDNTSSTGGTTYNLAGGAGFMQASSSAADTTGNAITVSNVAAPSITSATYDYNAGALVVTGQNFVKSNGATNDIDVTKLTITGEGGATYTLSTSSNVEITNGTTFTVTLSGADIQNVEALLNKNGTTSATAGTPFNLAAAEDWAAGAAAAVAVADLTGNGITVSNFANPTVTSTTYDWSTGTLVLTGTNFVVNAGAANDIDVSLITFTGEGGVTYTLTDSSDVEITSATTATVTLSTTDRLAVNGLLNKDGTTSATAGTGYNVAFADNWMAGSPGGNSIADASTTINVSNYAGPTIGSATYNYASNVLTVTGTNFVSKAGAANDIDISLLTFTGEGGATYTLTSATDVEITSATEFSVTLSGADLVGVESLLNKDGTSADSGTPYNLAAADNWLAQAPSGNNIADATVAITVSSYAVPAISSVTYDWSNGQLVLTGTNFVAQAGGANDIDVSLLTITGEGGSTYTLTSTDVEITSATTATVTLNATDQLNIHGLLNKNGTQADDGSTNYNLAAGEDWMTGAPSGNNVVDATTGITVSNYAAPSVSSATYDSDSGILVVTGSNFVKYPGAANDIDISKITLTGEGGSYTITSAGDVEITSATSFTVTFSGSDKTNVDSRLDQIGTSSSGGSTYNIAVADNWLAGAPASADVSDTTSNAITVSISPTITSAAYNASTGVFVVTGTNIQETAGATNDVVANKFTITGENGETYTFTDTANVERTSASQFTLTLSATDKAAVNQILNKDGGSSTGNKTYNFAGAAGWNAAFGSVSDTTGNTITVSNVAAPIVSSATYDYNTNTLVVTGSGLLKASGANNDIDVSMLTLTGENGATYTLSTSSDVDITNGTSFTITLSGADIQNVEALLNKDGTTSAASSTTFNIAAAEDWATGADSAVNVADLSGNGITVSNFANPVIASATYNWATGELVLTGSNFIVNSGAANDIDVSLITFTGEGAATYTLTDSTDVEITSATSATITLSATDFVEVNSLLNSNGTTSATSSTTFNIALADNWMAGAPAANNIADATTGVTVSNFAIPTITSSTYDADTGTLTITGQNFIATPGASNDVDASDLTFTGQNGSIYTLIGSADVEITSATQITVILNGTDKTAVNALLDKLGQSSTDSTTYNLAGAAGFVRAFSGASGADTTGNPIDVTKLPSAGNTATQGNNTPVVSNPTPTASAPTVSRVDIDNAGLEGQKSLIGETGGVNLGSSAPTAAVYSTTSIQVMAGDGKNLTAPGILEDPSSGVDVMSIVRNAVTQNNNALNNFYGSSSRSSQSDRSTGNTPSSTSEIGGSINSLISHDIKSTLSGLGSVISRFGNTLVSSGAQLGQEVGQDASSPLNTAELQSVEEAGGGLEFAKAGIKFGNDNKPDTLSNSGLPSYEPLGDKIAKLAAKEKTARLATALKELA